MNDLTQPSFKTPNSSVIYDLPFADYLAIDAMSALVFGFFCGSVFA